MIPIAERDDARLLRCLEGTEWKPPHEYPNDLPTPRNRRAPRQYCDSSLLASGRSTRRQLALRGIGEGHYGRDLMQDSTMTNAAVAQQVKKQTRTPSC